MILERGLPGALPKVSATLHRFIKLWDNCGGMASNACFPAEDGGS
jgi:hypothetical protein